MTKTMKILNVIIGIILIMAWAISTTLVFPMLLLIIENKQTFRSWFKEPKGMYVNFIKPNI